MPRQKGLAEIGGASLLQMLPYLAMGMGGMGGMGQDLSPAQTLSGLAQQAGGVGADGFFRPLGVNYF
jgi:hypothetical protein